MPGWPDLSKVQVASGLVFTGAVLVCFSASVVSASSEATELVSLLPASFASASPETGFLGRPAPMVAAARAGRYAQLIAGALIGLVWLSRRGNT